MPNESKCVYLYFECADLFDQPVFFEIKLREGGTHEMMRFGFECVRPTEWEITKFNLNPVVPEMDNGSITPEHLHWLHPHLFGVVFAPHIGAKLTREINDWVAENEYDPADEYIQSTCDDREGK